MKKLSLAVFNTQPPHLFFGGVERRIVETTKLLRNDVAATVYSGTKGGFKKPAIVDGINYVPCFSTDALFPLDNWFFNQSISRADDAIRADVHESHAVSGYGFLRSLRKRGLTGPFIQTVHGVLADEYLRAVQSGSRTFRAKVADVFMWKLSRLEKESAENATLVVTVSHYSAGRIVQLYGVDGAKIRTVPNGVDPQKFKPFDARETKRRIGVDNKECVLFVGRLIPRKGLFFLVEAAKRVVKERSQTVFLVVGTGPLRNYLMAYLRKLGLSGSFVFLGDVSENALAALYNCADVFAFPSIQEGLGIALLEAQATAKPVVAFNIGGVNEAVLNKETGLLVKPDSRELAEAILRFLSDRSLREQTGRKGRAFVSSSFSWAVCAQKMLQIYREALAGYA